MRELLKRFKIFYELLDASGRVGASNPDFWRYLDLPVPAESVPITEVFGELVGREGEVLSIIGSGREELTIPVVSRSKRAGGGRVYFNLRIMPAVDGEPSAIVVLEDETPVMESQQKVVQSNNEVILLKHDLEKQNQELSAVNEKLDVLGKSLTEKNEELSRLLSIIRTQNHDLESKVRLRTRELQDSRLAIITKLARAAEYRDVGTGDHIYRIGRSCVLIGKTYGLSEAECDMLFHSSLLHDVGKIGIPDSILLKPGKLTSGEWEIMKNHAAMGADLLGGDKFILFELSRDIAKYHHEKWNGNGYPDGLKGDKIPIMSRICSIADVFDALTSRRPYKEAWSVDQALAEIKKESGVSFDPEVVEAFFKVLADILRLRLETESVENLMPEIL